MHDQRGCFLEIPAHLGIAPSEAVLRALLDAPADLPLTQWYMTVPLKDRRFEGCCWKFVGPIVPITADRPGYPFCQRSLPQPTRLQAWLWRVFKPPPPPYPRPLPPGWMRPWADIRWHPERGVWVTLELGPDDGRDVSDQLWTWSHYSLLSARGRRRELAYAVSRQAFEQRLVTVIQELEYGTIPRVATRPRVANQLSMCVRSLYNYLARYGLNFDEIRTRVRQQHA